MLVVIDANVFVSAAIQRGASTVDDPDTIETETRDSNDDCLVAIARAHNVDVLVSGDKDLLEWEPQRPPVVTPTQFENRDSAG